MLSPKHIGWCVYLLLCADGSFYAGITNDLEKRVVAHAKGKGARYTRAKKPVAVAAFKSFPDRSTASKAEYSLKQLPRAKKCAFLGGCILPS